MPCAQSQRERVSTARPALRSSQPDQGFGRGPRLDDPYTDWQPQEYARRGSLGCARREPLHGSLFGFQDGHRWRHREGGESTPGRALFAGQHLRRDREFPKRGVDHQALRAGREGTLRRFETGVGGPLPAAARNLREGAGSAVPSRGLQPVPLESVLRPAGLADSSLRRPGHRRGVYFLPSCLGLKELLWCVRNTLCERPRSFVVHAVAHRDFPCSDWLRSCRAKNRCAVAGVRAWVPPGSCVGESEVGATCRLGQYFCATSRPESGPHRSRPVFYGAWANTIQQIDSGAAFMVAPAQWSHFCRLRISDRCFGAGDEFRDTSDRRRKSSGSDNALFHSFSLCVKQGVLAYPATRNRASPRMDDSSVRDRLGGGDDPADCWNFLRDE